MASYFRKKICPQVTGANSVVHFLSSLGQSLILHTWVVGAPSYVEQKLDTVLEQMRDFDSLSRIMQFGSKRYVVNSVGPRAFEFKDPADEATEIYYSTTLIFATDEEMRNFLQLYSQWTNPQPQQVTPQMVPYAGQSRYLGSGTKQQRFY